MPESLRRLQMDGIVYRRLKPPTVMTVSINLGCRRVENGVAIRRFIAMSRRLAA